VGLTLITPPAADPVTLDEVKDNSRVEVTDDDGLIALLIKAATTAAEKFTRRQLITAQLRLSLDEFPPADEAIQLPLPPIQSIESIKYIDIEGVEQTLTGFQEALTDEPARLKPEFDKFWPDTRLVVEAVKVEFTAGFGLASTDVPDAIRQAIIMTASHWYEHREAASELKVEEVPLGAQALLQGQRAFRFL